VQHGVGVVEKVALGDLRVAVVLPELLQAPVGDVVLPLPLGVVAVEAEESSVVKIPD